MKVCSESDVLTRETYLCRVRWLKKEEEDSILYLAKDAIFFHLSCPTNPAQEI
jgi:hypothetical protein